MAIEDITFNLEDGSSINAAQILDKILKEGKLGTTTYYNPKENLKCAIGIICDAFQDDLVPQIIRVKNQRELQIPISERYLKKYGVTIVRDNDLFGGTPKERCFYIHDRLRMLFETWEDYK